MQQQNGIWCNIIWGLILPVVIFITFYKIPSNAFEPVVFTVKLVMTNLKLNRTTGEPNIYLSFKMLTTVTVVLLYITAANSPINYVLPDLLAPLLHFFSVNWLPSHTNYLVHWWKTNGTSYNFLSVIGKNELLNKTSGPRMF